MKPPGRFIVYVLFLLSGCTGLVYEIVWTRQLVLLLGATTYAITTVLVAFMSGLALGSYLAGRWARRLARPGWAYAVLEIAIGAYALAVPWLLDLAEPLYRAMYPHVEDVPWVLTAARFCVCALVLLPPTTFMGATLPLLVRYLTRSEQVFGRNVGQLYGINTCGAMLGTLMAGFWLLPAAGLASTIWAAAAANLVIGLIALAALRGRVEPLGEPAPQPRRGRRPSAEPMIPYAPEIRRAMMIVLAASGFAAMVYQIAWTRALIMSIGSSTYAFTCILAAFIMGLGFGSLAVARWVDRWRHPVLIVAGLELGIAIAAVCIVPIHGLLPAIVREVVAAWHADYGVLLMIEFVLVIAVTIVPTFLMGAIFPLAARVIRDRPGEPEAAVGRAYAVNTLGTIAGAFLAGFVLIRGDVLGIQHSIVAAAAINALAGAGLILVSRPAGALSWQRGGVVVAGLAAVTIIGLVSGRWNRELMTSGPFMYGARPEAHREVLFFFEDVDTTVSVERIGGADGTLTLSINGKPDASNSIADLRTQLLLGHLPALLHPRGRSACVIGLGSGMTLDAIAKHPTYEEIDCVEISEGVVQAAVTWFAEDNNEILAIDPRVRLLRADGRNHLLLTDRTYDLIVSEPSNPWIAGVANLFTREFFDLCRARLAPDGLLMVWLQGYSTSTEDFRMVVRTLLEAFEFVSVWELADADYGLIAGRAPPRVPLDDVIARYEERSVHGDLYRIALLDLGSVLGSYVTSGDPLRDWSADAPVHTDDNARLEFSAPRHLHRREHARIAHTLSAFQRSPFEEVVQARDDRGHRAVADRMTATISARRKRIEAGLLRDRGEHAAAFELLLEAYAEDPGNYLGYLNLVHCHEEMDPRGGRAQVRLDLIAALPLPPLASPGGMSRTEMAELLRAFAEEAGEHGHPSAAAAYLELARRIENQAS